jgi:hypothetical protein
MFRWNFRRLRSFSVNAGSEGASLDASGACLSAAAVAADLRHVEQAKDLVAKVVDTDLSSIIVSSGPTRV